MDGLAQVDQLASGLPHAQQSFFPFQGGQLEFVATASFALCRSRTRRRLRIQRRRGKGTRGRIQFGVLGGGNGGFRQGCFTQQVVVVVLGQGQMDDTRIGTVPINSRWKAIGTCWIVSDHGIMFMNFRHSKSNHFAILLVSNNDQETPQDPTLWWWRMPDPTTRTVEKDA